MVLKLQSQDRSATGWSADVCEWNTEEIFASSTHCVELEAEQVKRRACMS